MKVFLFLMALFLASCSQKVEIEQITETETTAPKKTISGILNGNINNLSMIGVRHEIEPGFNKVQLFEEIESLFALQNDKKVLIIDGPSPKEKYGQIFQATEPKGWLTEKTIETHNIFQLIDVRPRTAEYGQVLNSFLLEVDSLVKKGDITFSIENKNGFPVYTIEETSVHTSSVSNIENILKEEKSFQDDLNLRILSTCNRMNMEYLIFAGAIHVYRVWLETGVGNLYFGLDEKQLHEVARMVAIQKWFEKHIL